jgi:hypothetical protein
MSRIITLTRDLLLETYQKELLKYIEVGSDKLVNKKDVTLSDLYTELESKINEQNISINRKLLNYFKNKI